MTIVTAAGITKGRASFLIRKFSGYIFSIRTRCCTRLRFTVQLWLPELVEAARAERFLSTPSSASVGASETGGYIVSPPVLPFLSRPGPAFVNCPRVPVAFGSLSNWSARRRLARTQTRPARSDTSFTGPNLTCTAFAVVTTLSNSANVFALRTCVSRRSNALSAPGIADNSVVGSCLSVTGRSCAQSPQ